jgi:hypothetical protein
MKCGERGFNQLNIRKLIAVLGCVSCALLSQMTASTAEMLMDLSDSSLDRRYDWAAFLDMQSMPDYLNYPGSQLRPITNVKINFRTCQRTSGQTQINGFTRPYEDLWYHESTPIGCRRYRNSLIDGNRTGVIIVGPSVEPEKSQTLANALVRLLVDFEIRDLNIAMIVVPKSIYERLSDNLSRYGFQPNIGYQGGQQISLHLASNPRGNDGYLFLSKYFE